MDAVLEVCCDSVDAAKAAFEGKAQRIELCQNLLEGGTTPSYGLIKLAREAFPQPGRMMVLIRPRGGDFVYTHQELSVMMQDIDIAAQLGADGIVIGCLTPAGSVDLDSTGKLLAAAKSRGLDVTFHRAIDMTFDPSEALNQIKALGIRRVLTSGCKPSAMAGCSTIARLVGEAGLSCSIMAGGGVNDENVGAIVARTGVREVHSTAARSIFSSMQHRPSGMSLVSAQPPSDYAWRCAHPEEVASVKAAAEKAVKQLPR